MSNTDMNHQEELKNNLENETKKENETTDTIQENLPEEKYAELNDKYIRLYADFENFRKRVSKEKADLIKYASEDIFKQIIPVLDDFERAFKSIATINDINVMKQGEELIYNKFKGILIQNGLQEMKVMGEPFDSEIHEAITNIPSPTKEQKGKIIDEVEKGYYINGKVVRHAKVVVGN